MGFVPRFESQRQVTASCCPLLGMLLCCLLAPPIPGPLRDRKGMAFCQSCQNASASQGKDSGRAGRDRGLQASAKMPQRHDGVGPEQSLGSAIRRICVAVRSQGPPKRTRPHSTTVRLSPTSAGSAPSPSSKADPAASAEGSGGSAGHFTKLT